MKFDLEGARNIARIQEQYYQEKKLYYGHAPKENGDASWWLALNNHQIQPSEHDYLTSRLPKVISDFHLVSARLMRRVFVSNESSPALDQLRNQLTTGVTPETLEIYQQAILVGQTKPFSSRPDTLIPANFPKPAFPIIEYNVDGTADKGNTEGANEALSLALGETMIGSGLANLFVDGVREMFPSGEQITVATVLPVGYRNKYDAQNRYFSDRANEIGKQSGVRWVTAYTDEIDITPKGLYTSVTGQQVKLDVVDREFKAPGFTNLADQTKDGQLLRALLDQKTLLLGTPLPLGDKVLLSVLFNPSLEPYILKDLGDDAVNRLKALRKAHAETHTVSPDQTTVNFDGQDVDLLNNAPAENQVRLVIKSGGDSEIAGESRGVYFSEGKGSERWQDQLSLALSAEQGIWVVQKVITPESFEVGTIKNSRSKPQTYTVPNRFAPYYVNGRLGRVLVTDGTDREVRMGLPKIHMQRDNTYSGVVVVDKKS